MEHLIDYIIHVRNHVWHNLPAITCDIMSVMIIRMVYPNADVNDTNV